MDVDGLAREVLVHVSPLAPGAASVPLVIDYHGYTATAPQLVTSAALGTSADRDGSLVFYPLGIADGFGQPDWVFPGAPGTAPAGVDGVRIPGTPAWFPELLPVEDAIAAWATRDGCDAGPVTTPSDGGVVLAWQGCDAPVELHRLDTGGHAYPALASELVRQLAMRVVGRIPGPSM